jgi:8-oxo-dGTP pyrophosphatase MutT (NUDIX family)
MATDERSAGVVVYRGESAEPLFLLLDYGRFWDYPKGHVEAGEADEAAALRELREETGIAAAVLAPDFRHEIQYFFRDRRKGLIRKTVVFFLAETRERDVSISHEHAGYDWLAYADARRRVTYASAKGVLDAAATHLGLPVEPPAPRAASTSPRRRATQPKPT